AENYAFVRYALGKLHWNFWPEASGSSLNVLAQVVLSQEKSRARALCLKELFHAIEYKNALLQAHKQGLERDVGQRDCEEYAARRLEGGALREERLERDTTLEQRHLRRVAELYPYVYREFATSTLRIYFGSDTA